MRSELRPHQTEAMCALRQAIGGGKRRPMVQAPTGAGKTLLAAAIVEGARAKGNRVLFTVPALSLIDQTVQMFYEEGITDVGVIQANHCMTDWAKPIQIASVQTLRRRTIPEAHIAIIDEAHRWFDFYGEWMKLPEWQNKPMIGLSATPWTKGLGLFFDDLIIAATTAELIEQGYLSKFRVFAPAHPDLTGVRTLAGDYREDDLSKAMDKSPLIADVVNTWIRLGEGRSTLCFCVDCAHAKHMQERFLAAGVAAEYMDAFTTMPDREAIKRRFHDGQTRVVCNVGVLTTGVDWDVRCLILARPTKSEILFVQIVGRALRTAEGKEDAMILDHSDTHLRLGFVTDIHHDALDDGRIRQKAALHKKLPKECPKCTFLKPTGISICPSCGFKAVAINGTHSGDGELAELKLGKEKFTIYEKRIFFAELKWYARTHGYKQGWAANKYKERMKVWPDHPEIREALPAEPRPQTISWIKSRAIAWSKSKNRHEAHA